MDRIMTETPVFPRDQAVPRFVAETVLFVFLAHALAFFLHEYSHAVTAWLLGFKADPLALHYGHADIVNILLQREIDENVAYGPIYAAHRDGAAALIALSGMALGNGALYVLCFWCIRRVRPRDMNRPAVRFLFWLALMGAANLWSYAPIRTITTHGDMAEMARGLHMSPWLLLPLVTLPSILAMYSFFFRLVVPNWAWLFAGGPARPVFAAAMTGLLYFGFFGAAGLFGSYGDVCALLSIVSLFVLFPLSVVFCLLATGMGVIGFGQGHGQDGGAPV
ncbi:conserved hypothetical protein [Gluconacetobacter diazotrophicus PA1 5]|uniref:Peptidase M50 n=2 Tax=Gluconacetobacter diazotrophicus TaxID=33996 RepID=A9HB43_GLUDA|nr:conserved hypothetical protein [Gluconacetobacter diazotrophicus PA1 5]